MGKSAEYYPLIMLDIWERLDRDSAAYFREKREETLGNTLEDLQAAREVGSNLTEPLLISRQTSCIVNLDLPFLPASWLCSFEEAALVHIIINICILDMDYSQLICCADKG